MRFFRHRQGKKKVPSGRGQRQRWTMINHRVGWFLPGETESGSAGEQPDEG